MGTWNWLDWTLVVVLFLSALTAFAKGFIRELISLAALVAGLVIATLEYERASDALSPDCAGVEFPGSVSRYSACRRGGFGPRRQNDQDGWPSKD